MSSVLRPSSQQLSGVGSLQGAVPAQGLPMEALGPLGSAAEATGTAVTPVPTTGALDGQSRGRVGRGRTWPRPLPSPWVGEWHRPQQ